MQLGDPPRRLFAVLWWREPVHFGSQDSLIWTSPAHQDGLSKQQDSISPTTGRRWRSAGRRSLTACAVAVFKAREGFGQLVSPLRGRSDTI